MSLLASALASQPQQPRATIGPTDVLGAYSLATNTAEQQYQAKLQQQNALYGGLAGLGGAGLTAYILKGGLFGKTPPVPPATPPATPAGLTSIWGDSPSGVPFASDTSTLPFNAAGGATDTAGAAPVAAANTADAGTALAPDWLMSSLYGTPAAGAAGTLDAGTALGGGSVAAADAAAAAPAVAEGAADAGAGAATLADLLPFLFA